VNASIAVTFAALALVLAPSVASAKFSFATCIDRAQQQCREARCQALGETACEHIGASDNAKHDPCIEAAANACTALAVKKLKLGKPAKD
jgi:hypothetical protein